jgi:hypothetical protein
MVIAFFAIAAALRLATASETAGCQKDIDCKGTRICEQHECVFPRPKPATQGQPSGPAQSVLTQPSAPESAPEAHASEAQVAARRTAPREVSPFTCAPLATGVVAGRAEVLAAPDSTATWVATIRQPGPACVGTERQGFGFRVVQLADGTTGFVKDSSITDLVLPPPLPRPVASVSSSARVTVPPPAVVPAKFAPAACAPLVPAIATEGAAIREGPDSLTRVVVTLRAATPVCAAVGSQGFGFRHVRFADATTGFIKDSELSE